MALVLQMTCLSVRTVDGKRDALLSTSTKITEFDASQSAFLRLMPVACLPFDRGRRYRLTLELDE